MYSISPDFLKFKIEDSLKTLDLDCLDLVMLEDPVFNFLQENEVKISLLNNEQQDVIMRY